MHKSSYDEMAANLAKYCAGVPAGSYVADIGSADVNGTYRPLIEPHWDYTGLDLRPGQNVHKVMVSEYDTGLPDNTADIVICGQVLEHCRNPFKLAAEMVRICVKGGWLLIVAPFSFNEHRFPVDCWRFLPDGMRELFPADRVSCKAAYIVGKFVNHRDCWFIGVKK